MTKRQKRQRAKVRRHSASVTGSGHCSCEAEGRGLVCTGRCEASQVRYAIEREPWWLRLFRALHVSAKSW